MFGFVEELNCYIFGVYYISQNFYSVNNNKADYGQYEKIIINIDDKYSDCFHLYIMKEDTLSVTTWDYVSPFESNYRKTYVINTKEKTIYKTFL